MIEPEKNSISVQYEVIIADNVEKDIISNFSCGKEYFDSYFRNHEKELTKTYIWRNTTNNEVVAFASIACSGLVVKAGNGNIRVYPAVYINGKEEKGKSAPCSHGTKNTPRDHRLITSKNFIVRSGCVRQCGA